MADPDGLFERTAQHAAGFVERMDVEAVDAAVTLRELRSALSRPLTEEGQDARQVIDELVRDVEPGILGSAGGRFFGWVIGGGVPAAVAADWLTSVWDQNAALYECAPAAAVVEEVVGRWLKELLGLPSTASFALTTGAQMAHVTALAAARGHLLAQRGHDVERHGLGGAPRLRVLCGGVQHASIDRAIRLLGLGTEAVVAVGTDRLGRLDPVALNNELAADPDAATVVCLQAGEINTGSFDPFVDACVLARQHAAWVHVDGAFGLWAAVSPRYRHLTEGVGMADSWTVDGHKWLNVPFDSGFAIVRDPDAHRTAMTTRASYLVTAADRASGTNLGDEEPARDQIDWNPEWSRRARALPVYAALRSLGHGGLRTIVENCCRHARRLVTELGSLPGVEVLVEPQINQGLVRFASQDGDHDRRTEEVVARIQSSGEAWFGLTTWNDMRAMRISVVSWRTNDRDVDRAIDAVRQVLL